MEMTLMILLPAAGMAVGLMAGLLLGRRGASASRMEAESLRVRVEEREESMREMLRRQEESHRRALSDRDEAFALMQSRFDETVERMQSQLRDTTSEMLRLRQEEFRKSSREDIGAVLRPLEESIRRMKESIADNTLRHSEFSGVFTANIENLLRHSDAARASADRLANALRGNTRVQGSWGETILKELLETHGLREGVHFETQTVMRDEKGNIQRGPDGSTMRPDLVLHLDSRRDVIIDSKVSLSAYFDYVDATTEEGREAALRQHVESLQRHVDELARKDYSSYVAEPRMRMEYVIMFVPNNAAIHAAQSLRPDFWRKAMERNVYIADEQTLYAALKIVNLTWRQIARAESHQKVYGLAEEMLNRVGIFMEKYQSIGKNLEATVRSYDEGMAKLRDGGQSIPATCAKLRSLGARQSRVPKNVPPELVGIGFEEIDTEAEDRLPGICDNKETAP